MRLLSDIRDLFTAFKAEFVSSDDLMIRLRRIDEAPWRELDLTVRKLANRLRPFGVKSRHNTEKTVRGYWRDSFTDAFARYLYVQGAPTVHPSEKAPEQEEPPDASKPPDGSIRPEENIRPDVSAGQAPDGTDGRMERPGRTEAAECACHGGPTQPQCKLCPSSPTYWKR